MADGLHLVALHLDPGRLYREAVRARLPLHDLDSDYLVHAALAGLFGDAAPAPWWSHREPGGGIRVLGHTDRDASALRTLADDHGDVEMHALVDWSRFASKPMRSTFEPGTVLTFGVRACPVVRLASAKGGHAKGAEVDAFLPACWAAGESVAVSREAVYVDWLRGQLERRGARLVDAEVEGFLLKTQYRRSQGDVRTGRRGVRPEVSFTGRLQVDDPAAFDDAVRVGIGRQRSFGFGLLRLGRP